MTVNFSSNVGYAPLRSNSNVNFAQRNENMEAPKKSNTKKYVAAGVGLAAIAAAVVFRKPLGAAVKNIMGKFKMPAFKTPDFSAMGKDLKTNITDFAKHAKVKAEGLAAEAKKAAEAAAGKVSEKFANTTASFKAVNFGDKFGKIWQGAKDYAVKGWEMAKTYGQKVVDWAMNLFNKLFHKPV